MGLIRVFFIFLLLTPVLRITLISDCKGSVYITFIHNKMHFCMRILSVMGALLVKRSGALAPAPCKKMERRSRSFIIKEARYRSRSSKKRARTFPKTIERRLYSNGLYNYS